MKKRIIFLGFCIGFIDGIAASLHTYAYSELGPKSVFLFIASGWLGEAAFSGGYRMLLLGLGTHFFIAIAWVILFFILLKNSGFVYKYYKMSGLIYGLGIWVIMNLVVIPNSNAPQIQFSSGAALSMIAIHCFLGFVIALFTKPIISKFTN
jgi:hypothetical protein